MDDLEGQLGPFEDLEDDNDSSDRKKKSKLPLVNQIQGELYINYISLLFMASWLITACIFMYNIVRTFYTLKYG